MPTGSRRDSSFLEWHYKQPSSEELTDQYECFTEEEWKFHYQASKESTSLSSKKKNIPELMNVEAKKLACEDCDLPYQLRMRREGLCHPVEWDITPMGRMGAPDE